SDLRAVLLAKIRSRISEELHIPRTARDELPYRLCLVYSEYKKRIDVACLDPQKAVEVLPEPQKGFDTYIYDLPVLVGIEVKYRKMGDTFGFSTCLSDLEKLKKLRDVQHAFVLAFVQNADDVKDF